MHFSSTQKAKLVLIINFIVLCLIIISTPHFIREGISVFTEEAVEAFFLTIELLALFVVFKHYDFQVKKHEEIAKTLNFKLEKKERELLNALEYLGRVNVQVSMIKTLLEQTRVPSTKGQLLEVFSELLRIVCSTTKENSACLRILNLDNLVGLPWNLFQLGIRQRRKKEGFDHTNLRKRGREKKRRRKKKEEQKKKKKRRKKKKEKKKKNLRSNQEKLKNLIKLRNQKGQIKKL